MRVERYRSSRNGHAPMRMHYVTEEQEAIRQAELEDRVRLQA